VKLKLKIFSRERKWETHAHVPNDKKLLNLVKSQRQGSEGFHVDTIKASLLFFNLKMNNHPSESMEDVVKVLFEGNSSAIRMNLAIQGQSSDGNL